jgi:hypothetical protein
MTLWVHANETYTEYMLASLYGDPLTNHKVNVWKLSDMIILNILYVQRQLSCCGQQNRLRASEHRFKFQSGSQSRQTPSGSGTDDESDEHAQYS